MRKSLEDKFRDAVAEIKAKLEESKSAYEAAEKLAEKHGIPVTVDFYVDDEVGPGEITTKWSKLEDLGIIEELTGVTKWESSDCSWMDSGCTI